MKSIVHFGNTKLKDAYMKLKETSNSFLYKSISRAIDDLEENAFCGIQIPKRQIPRKYIDKFKIDNLWKYNLPNSWRLIYSVANSEICIVSIILEWMPHKQYEKTFNY